jgi:hypothetical protein
MDRAARADVLRVWAAVEPNELTRMRWQIVEGAHDPPAKGMRQVLLRPCGREHDHEGYGRKRDGQQKDEKTPVEMLHGLLPAPPLCRRVPLRPVVAGSRAPTSPRARFPEFPGRHPGRSQAGACSLARPSHQPSAAPADRPALAASDSVGHLDVVHDSACGGLGRLPCIRGPLRCFAARSGEKAGLAPSASGKTQALRRRPPGSLDLVQRVGFPARSSSIGSDVLV